MVVDGEKLLKRLEPSLKNIRGRYSANADMSKVTWFRAGGPVELLYQPADEEDLCEFLRVLPRDVPLLIVGIGSNLLARDGGISGVAIRLSAKGFGDIKQVSETALEVGTAVPDKRIAAAALDAEIAGFHFYHGIPGGLGGALRMNAGANDANTAKRVVSVRAVDRDGNIHVLSKADMGYEYRHCGAPLDLIFVSALLEGEKGDKATIQAAMDDVAKHRETSQPVREKTGGSTFKNPEGHSAWRLIEAAGGRGLRIGGAEMSLMHCNFMINKGDATGYDLELLGETVRAKVFEHAGIKLEWEIKRLGEFEPGRDVKPFLGKY